MGAHVADNIRHAYDDQQHRVHQAGDDEQGGPNVEKGARRMFSKMQEGTNKESRLR